MSKHLWIAGFDIPEPVRDVMRRLFPPVFPSVYLNTITIAYAVALDFKLPVEPVEITVVGTVQTRITQALCVSVGDHLKRPDGRPYFIAVSAEEGVAPHLAGNFEFSEVKILPTNLMFKFSAVAELKMRRKAAVTRLDRVPSDPLREMYASVSA